MTASQDPIVGAMHQWIDTHMDEIVVALQGVLKIPSVKAQSSPGAPFGKSVREALDYTLALSTKLGFRTRCIDGYAGDAEFGEGAEYVGVLGHLDVVPEGDGWQYPPYGATLESGYIYSRGSEDDKGPTYAALFAAKALMETGITLRRRVRIIFGCDEESGFGCVHHYFETAREERPAVGFTPDANFPLIYAEKGIANLVLTRSIQSDSTFLHVERASGGLRPNMVPDKAEAFLSGSKEQLDEAEAVLKRFWDRNVTVESTPHGLLVTAIGKNAHGATPEIGDNAVARLAKALLTADLPNDRSWLQWLADSVDTEGKKLGIAYVEEVTGPLSSNLGILSYSGGHCAVTYNVRYPVKWTIEDVTNRVQPTITAAGWSLGEVHNQAPLYVPLDQEPVATLLRVYREETGDMASDPLTTGGGTYARATPFVVAFGPSLPGSSDGPAHQPDERIAIESIRTAAKIYARALYELAR